MRWLLAPLLALSWLTGTGVAAWGADPEVWYNPHGPSDMLNMWTDTAPWQNAAQKVRVLGLVHWWVRSATDSQILAISDFAKRHHMKVELEVEAITRFASEACGHTEGYTAPTDLPGTIAILKRLNVHVDAMAMDEPVWFGHYSPDSRNCRLSVPDLVARIASNVSTILAQYPNIQVYEIETLPAVTNFPDWRQTLTSFRAGLSKAIGKNIRGIQMDVDWGTPAWIPALRDMNTFLHQQNMGLGIIYDGTGFARSDIEWMNQATQHFEYIEGVLGIIPDEAIFTSWQKYPATNMPETSPTALTWLINRYIRDRPVLSAQFVGRGAHGRLTDASGKPIANATINAYVPGVDFTLPLPATVIQDVVPANAVKAYMGIRLNTECNCQGMNDVLVGTLKYQEIQGGSSQFSIQYPPVHALVQGAIVDGEWVGGTKVTRVITTPTQTFHPTWGTFPVTPGAQFTFTIPTSTIGAYGWYGNIFLLWIDANGNSLTRLSVIPDPGKRLMSTTTTAADGTFQLPKIPRVGPGSAPVTIEFSGDDAHRSVGWSPLQ